MGALRIGVLGPLEVLDDERRVDLPGGKATTLLAMLAINANQVVSTDRLTDGLWSDATPGNPLASLQVYVSNLRRAMGAPLVQRDGAGYMLRIAPDQLDITRFEALAADGRAALADGRWEQAGALLGAALALWRGPALGDLRDDPFAVAAVTRWEEARLAAWEDRIEADLALGHHSSVVAEIQGLLVEHPFRERLVGQLMVALYRAGRQAEALGAYQRLRRDLVDQLGIEPSAALTALDLRILGQDRDLDWVPPRTAVETWAPPIGYVGRSAETAALRAAYRAALDSGARMAVIAGEPGMGKTRLALRGAAAAEAAGATVLWGAGFESGWFRPYGPFGEALESYVMKIGADRLAELIGPAAAILAPLLPGQAAVHAAPAADGDEQRIRIYEAFVQWLRSVAALAPTVLVLDDMQWMDRGTLELARYALHALSRQRLLIIGTFRDTDLPDGHPLHDELRRLRGQTNYVELRLSGLTAADVEELAAGHGVAAGTAEAIVRHTGGNPFYVREVLADLAAQDERNPSETAVSDFVLETRPAPTGVASAPPAEIPTPPDLRRLIHARVARLEPDARELLTTASVEGTSFSLRVVARATDLDEAAALDALDRAVKAGIVEPGRSPDVYTFTGGLVRDALYATLTPSRRVRAHRRVAEAIEATARFGTRPAELARHYHLSRGLGGEERGVAPALRAAHHAVRSGAHEDAASMLGVAIDLLPDDDARLPALLAERAEALAWSLQFEEAARVGEDAAQALGDRDGPGAAADTLARTAMALYQAGSSRHARTLAEKGLAYAGERRDATWALLVLIAMRPGDVTASHRREAARLLTRSPEARPRFGFLYGALEAVYDSRQEVLDDPWATASALLDRAGELAGAADRFEGDGEESERSGRLAWAACCWAEAARAHCAMGDIDRANALVARAADLAGRVGPRGWLNGVLLGAADEINMAVDGTAGVAFQAAPPDLQSRVMQVGAGIGYGVLAAAYARTLARLGDADGAMESMLSVVPAIQSTPAWVLGVHRVASDAAETLWYLDRRDQAEVVESVLREKVLEPDFRRSMMDVRHALGRLCGVTQRPDEAVRWFADARTVLDEQRARPLRAVVDFDEALLWARAGEARLAQDWLDLATPAFTRLRMQGWVDRAARLRRTVS